MHNLKFMNIALEEARKAYFIGEVPVGAVLVNLNNKIIAKSYNKIEKFKSNLYHAELNVLNKISKKIKNYRLNDCFLYVTLKPCLMCLGAIILSRIKYVYYGSNYKKGSLLFKYDKVISNLVEEYKLNLIYLKNSNSEILLKKFFKEKR